MNKMQIAHDMALAMAANGNVPNEDIIAIVWQYADAMQAAADKRECKRLPHALLTKDKDGNCLHFNREFGHKKCMDCGASLEEWQPDTYPEYEHGRDYPSDAWVTFNGEARLAVSIKEDSLRKRPEALQPEVDWRLAPNDAIGWMIFDGSSTWLGEFGFLIENAPSFGFTGSHIVERPQ